jgi:hypothetical protein
VLCLPRVEHRDGVAVGHPDHAPRHDPLLGACKTRHGQGNRKEEGYQGTLREARRSRPCYDAAEPRDACVAFGSTGIIRASPGRQVHRFVSCDVR